MTRWASGCIAVLMSIGCTQFADLDDLRFDGSAASSGAGGSGGSAASAGGGGCSSGPETPVTIVARPGLDGDGYLSIPECGGSSVWDFWPQPTDCTVCEYMAIHMGVDPACAPGVVYRLFVRFDLTELPAGCIKTATLRLFYVEAGVVEYPARLSEIDDFLTLDVTDWNMPERRDLGEVVNPTTMPNTWRALDVTPALIASLESGAKSVAFKVQYENEQHDAMGGSAWYGIVAADNPEKQPELAVVVVPQ